MARQTPSEKVVVVRPAGDVAETRRRLADFGEVTDVEAPGVALLRVDVHGTSGKAARDRILAELDEVAWAEPLLVDDGGGELVPTGDTSVRFRTALSDEELAAFAARHGLALQRRNEFVPEQAVFAPAQPRSAYLPEVVESLQADPQVSEAWANTLSRYRRADRAGSPPTKGVARSTS